MGFLKNFIKNDTNFELFTYVLTVNKSISRKMALPLKTPLRNNIYLIIILNFFVITSCTSSADFASKDV